MACLRVQRALCHNVLVAADTIHSEGDEEFVNRRIEVNNRIKE